jgi:hypothetical protein
MRINGSHGKTVERRTRKVVRFVVPYGSPSAQENVSGQGYCKEKCHFDMITYSRNHRFRKWKGLPKSKFRRSMICAVDIATTAVPNKRLLGDTKE